MKLVVKSTLLSLLLFAPSAAVACTILPEAEQIQQDIEARRVLLQKVREIAAEATQVFVARVVEVQESEEDRVVDGKMRRLEIFRPVVNVLTSIKGSPSAEGIYWEEGRDRVVVSCNSTAYFNRISLIPTYRYLFYVRDNEIFRAQEFIDWPAGVSLDEELDIVQEVAEE